MKWVPELLGLVMGVGTVYVIGRILLLSAPQLDDVSQVIIGVVGSYIIANVVRIVTKA